MTTNTTPGLREDTAMTTIRGAALFAATLTTGLYAGLFYTFSVPVMPGLGQVDDETFVRAVQQINRAVENGWFMTIFLGAPALAALAAVLRLRHGHRRALAWTAAGFVLAATAQIITFVVHIPLNTTIDTAGDPGRIADIAGLRAGFEATWTRWNLARTITATAAFACLIRAVAVDGRGRTTP
ncbi:anthrone oxygenase family protein [Pseudonocardia sichuanensis]